MKFISIILLLTIFLVNCEGAKSKKNSSAGALALLLLQGGAACASSTTTAITNPGIVSSPSRTNYDVSGCNQNSLNAIGFSGQNVVTGLTGTTTSSIISSTGNVSSADDVNIEVTFILNSASAYLDIIGRSTGTPTSLTGPTIRISTSTLLAKGTSGTFSNIGSGILSTPVDKSFTYCMEIHQETDAHIIFFPSSCAQVTSKSAPYTYDVEVPTTFPGKGLGFVLNGATITNFKVGTKIATGGRLLAQ